ncbi:riboflavin kinase / FMN adenylyltransferase [Porphyromonas crevioricanis JCM 15906]|uniref:Riboflavin biosynthesis protein n=2 Tax=Porphyromonas crevioricanis TaxID=393921 RepID=A0AB34PI07_9PORP|nr:riboflavin biosynthesis protein RibF [Porphyromonas crevioricanis]KGN96313.1 hypothetical protein HQ38_02050 [Porphyromonas crevioricanis]GAD04554.1 riboflavin kinase / FMN adenylyltransferase [Porphyromonas crevioricanis JCM 15906]SJZ83866.1 riboflavin kinase / FMN adenylyltransferase [Porphyromonas crevioricanis]
MDQVVATIGTFDGVHKGHRFLINQVRKRALDAGLKSMAITFEAPPILVLRPELSPSFLSSTQEKVELLYRAGIDRVELLRFDKNLAALSARQFIQEILHEKLHVAQLVVGYDHRFGHNRSEGFEDYRRYGEELGMQVELASEFIIGNLELSSTTIRRLLTEGDLQRANDLLGYPYRISGKVVDGYKNGRLLGYPTANIEVKDPHKLLPADGVYAVRVRLPEKTYGGMLYIGKRPTFENGEHRSIEVNIFDIKADLYGSDIAVDLLAHTRGDCKFDSPSALREQLHQDAAQCKEILALSSKS